MSSLLAASIAFGGVIAIYTVGIVLLAIAMKDDENGN